MFNMGLTEILVIGAIALVIFGPEKLPGMARSLGKFITEAKRTVNGVKTTISEEIDQNLGPEIREAKTTVNSLNSFRSGNFGGSVEDILNKTADAIENKKEADASTTDSEKTKKLS